MPTQVFVAAAEGMVPPGQRAGLETLHCVVNQSHPFAHHTLSVCVMLKVVLESRPVLMLSIRNTDCGPQSISPETCHCSTATERKDTLNHHEM